MRRKGQQVSLVRKTDGFASISNRCDIISDSPSSQSRLCSQLHLMTDETRTPSWNYPTKANIVSHPARCRSYALNFVQLGAMSGLVRDAQPQDSFFVYCACLGLDDSFSTYMC